MNAEIRQFIKYTVVNGVLTALYFIIFYFINEISGRKYVISNLFSYIIATGLAFIFTKIYVFKTRKLYWNEIGEFIIARLIIVLVSSFGLWCACAYLRWGEYLAFIFVNGGCYIMSYFLNKKIFLRGDKKKYEFN